MFFEAVEIELDDSVTSNSESVMRRKEENKHSNRELLREFLGARPRRRVSKMQGEPKSLEQSTDDMVSKTEWIPQRTVEIIGLEEIRVAPEEDSDSSELAKRSLYDSDTSEECGSEEMKRTRKELLTECIGARPSRRHASASRAKTPKGLKNNKPFFSMRKNKSIPTVQPQQEQLSRACSDNHLKERLSNLVSLMACAVGAQNDSLDEKTYSSDMTIRQMNKQPDIPIRQMNKQPDIPIPQMDKQPDIPIPQMNKQPDMSAEQDATSVGQDTDYSNAYSIEDVRSICEDTEYSNSDTSICQMTEYSQAEYSYAQESQQSKFNLSNMAENNLLAVLDANHCTRAGFVPTWEEDDDSIDVDSFYYDMSYASL